MSGRKVRAARQVDRAAAPSGWPMQQRFWRSWQGGLIGLAAIAVVSGSFVLPDMLETEPAADTHAGMALGVDRGAGLPAGSQAPSFSEQDVETGEAITSDSVYGRRTLLFFSEGVMCQACFEQIKGLERFGADLDRRGIQLLSITPDSTGDLRQAVSQYGITTPVIADDDGDMSAAFNTLGQGMHGDTPGHAFVLVDRGKVLWYRDYWLAPTRSMYVEPERLLADIPVFDP